MPFHYKDATYYRLRVGAFTIEYRCKRRKLGCNAIIEFALSKSDPERPDTSKLMEFRPRVDDCEFSKSNFELRKAGKTELDPYINKFGRQISDQWRTTFMEQSRNAGTSRDPTISDRTREAAIDRPSGGWSARATEGDHLNEDRAIEEGETKRIAEDEEPGFSWSRATVTSSAAYRTDAADDLQDLPW